MTDTYIRWLLIITGVFTAASFGVFLQPVKQVALIYGENLTGTAVIMLVRHWGLLITGAGVLLIFAAFIRPLRVPMMVLGVVEKNRAGGINFRDAFAKAAYSHCNRRIGISNARPV